MPIIISLLYSRWYTTDTLECCKYHDSDSIKVRYVRLITGVVFQGSITNHKQLATAEPCRFSTTLNLQPRASEALKSRVSKPRPFPFSISGSQIILTPLCTPPLAMPLIMDDDMDVDINDLFGDSADMTLPSRPPPKQLFQRVDELRGSGACQYEPQCPFIT